MSTNTRPRPRPRPRVATSTSTPGTESSSTPVAQTSTSVPELSEQDRQREDEDAMFMKNRNRTAKAWKELDQRSQKAAAVASSPAPEWESYELPSPEARRLHLKGVKVNPLPQWTNSGVMSLLIASDGGSDDEAALQDASNATPKGSRKDRTPRGKRKRARSRSRSITPPPPLPIYQIQNARNLVRQAFDIAPRAASPTLPRDDVDEVVILDPELASIAAAAVKSGASSLTPNLERSETSGPPTVDIKVKWIPHPRDGEGKSKVWSFKMKRNDAFTEVFGAVADETLVLSTHLVVTYDGKRVFAASTPKGMQIWGGAEFEACSLQTFEFISTHRRTRHALAQDGPEGDPTTSSPVDATELAPVSEAESDVSGDDDGKPNDTFKLTLRSGSTNVTVTVRPTTKCGTIVATFLKRSGLKAAVPAKVKLVIDGDRMDPDVAIGTADLDDGDMVDVVGI